MDDAIATLVRCSDLFLVNIEELDGNGLRLVVAEGRPSGPPKSMHVGGTVISDCTPIDITEESHRFELLWNSYLAYSAVNESYASQDEQDSYEGERFRIYSKSPFLEYVSKATFACDGYPGPSRHYAVVCEDHVINIVSTTPPIAVSLP